MLQEISRRANRLILGSCGDDLGQESHFNLKATNGGWPEKAGILVGLVVV